MSTAAANSPSERLVQKVLVFTLENIGIFASNSALADWSGANRI
jgi:hypothetical protein